MLFVCVVEVCKGERFSYLKENIVLDSRISGVVVSQREYLEVAGKTAGLLVAEGYAGEALLERPQIVVALMSGLLSRPSVPTSRLR